MHRTNRKAESPGPEASSGAFQSNPVGDVIIPSAKKPQQAQQKPNPTPRRCQGICGITPSPRHTARVRERERHLPVAFAAVASKRAPLAMAGLLKKLLLAALSASASGAAPAAAALRPAPACAVAARRLFSTRGAPFRRDDFDSESEEEYSGDEDVVYGRLRSRSFSMFSSSDPFGEPMSLGRMLALMEDGEAAPRRGCWVSKEDADAVKLKVAMPGLGKEHVKVWADQDDLMIKGEGVKDTEFDDDDEAPPRYGHRIEFPADDFKMDQIKAEMKDGVLKVTVPKIKLEDRKDVFKVNVE